MIDHIGHDDKEFYCWVRQVFAFCYYFLSFQTQKDLLLSHAFPHPHHPILLQVQDQVLELLFLTVPPT